MNNKQTNKQYDIQHRDTKHTREADKWLSSNRLDAKTLTTENTLVQRALITANTLQREHALLLKRGDAYTLVEFQRAAATQRTRAKITDSFCYKVLNIQNSINRKLFKAHRKLNKAQSSKP
jgi:hypothetical protein